MTANTYPKIASQLPRKPGRYAVICESCGNTVNAKVDRKVAGSNGFYFPFHTAMCRKCKMTVSGILR